MNPTLFQISILNSFTKSQLYMPYFSFEIHVNQPILKLTKTKTSGILCMSAHKFIKYDISTLNFDPA